jgi:hypothetical protein
VDFLRVRPINLRYQSAASLGCQPLLQLMELEFRAKEHADNYKEIELPLKSFQFPTHTVLDAQLHHYLV